MTIRNWLAGVQQANRYISQAVCLPGCPRDGCSCGRVVTKEIIEALAEIGPNHIIEFLGEEGWVIEHSLQCRMEGTLLNCQFHKLMRSYEGGLYEGGLVTERANSRFVMSIHEDVVLGFEPLP